MPTPVESDLQVAKRIHRDSWNSRAAALAKITSSSMPLADRLALTAELSKLNTPSAAECPRKDRWAKDVWLAEQRGHWAQHFAATDALQREYGDVESFTIWLAKTIS